MTITLTREEAQQVLDALEKLANETPTTHVRVGKAISEGKEHVALWFDDSTDPLQQALYLNATKPEKLKPLLTFFRARLSAPEPERVKIDGNTSDGYHTFNELYEFRKAYNVALFNEWASSGKCFVHKSWRHNDGELCFGGGWFIVVAVLPSGQISNHYEAKDWGLFKVYETDKALFEFDGHTGSDVIARLTNYTAPPQREEGCAECGKKSSDGWALYCVKCSEPVREWVGLTDEEAKKTFEKHNCTISADLAGILARAITAKLKEKNT